MQGHALLGLGVYVDPDGRPSCRQLTPGIVAHHLAAELHGGAVDDPRFAALSPADAEPVARRDQAPARAGRASSDGSPTVPAPPLRAGPQASGFPWVRPTTLVPCSAQLPPPQDAGPPRTPCPGRQPLTVDVAVRHQFVGGTRFSLAPAVENTRRYLREAPRRRSGPLKRRSMPALRAEADVCSRQGRPEVGNLLVCHALIADSEQR